MGVRQAPLCRPLHTPKIPVAGGGNKKETVPTGQSHFLSRSHAQSLPSTATLLRDSVFLPVKWLQNTQFNEVEAGCGGQRAAVTDVAALGCKWGRKQAGQFSILLPHWTGTAGNWIWLKVPGGHGDSGWFRWVLTGSLCLPEREGKSILLSVANLHHQQA